MNSRQNTASLFLFIAIYFYNDKEYLYIVLYKLDYMCFIQSRQVKIFDTLVNKYVK